MNFLKKLFNKSVANKMTGKSKETDEEEMLKNAIEFIRVNADGENGDAESQFQYGVMFATGHGPGGRGDFPKDIKKAIFWLEKSAAQGNIDALAMIGRVFMDNGDPTSAVRYYRMAAEKNHEAACENLAMAYSMGDGVSKDDVEAHKWFLKAAKAGSAFSQYVTGNNYFNGIGVEENPNEAIKWFDQAARQGQPNAQFMMGQFYEFGKEDIEKAKKMYYLAAEQGNKEAKQRLQEL